MRKFAILTSLLFLIGCSTSTGDFTEENSSRNLLQNEKEISDLTYSSTPNSIILNWTLSSPQDIFGVRLSIEGEANSRLAILTENETVLSPTKTFYVFSGLNSDSRYSVFISTINKNGVESQGVHKAVKTTTSFSNNNNTQITLGEIDSVRVEIQSHVDTSRGLRSSVSVRENNDIEICFYFDSNKDGSEGNISLSADYEFLSLIETCLKLKEEHLSTKSDLIQFIINLLEKLDIQKIHYSEYFTEDIKETYPSLYGGTFIHISKTWGDTEKSKVIEKLKLRLNEGDTDFPKETV